MSDTTPDPNDPLWQAAQQIAAQKNASISQPDNSQSVGQSSVPNTQSNSVQDSKEPDENDPLWIAAQQIANKKNSDNDALWQAALHVTAKNGSLKKEDPDTYTNLVQQHALDNTYDPASQTAQDKVNGTDSRDFNFDVYNARYNQGFKTDTPFLEQTWDSVKGWVPGLVHSALDPAFWSRAGETAMQTLPMMAPGAAAVGVESPTISGRSLKQNIAELGAAGEVASQQDAASIRPLITDDYLFTNFGKMSKEEQNSYFDRKAQDQLRVEQAAKGQGYLDQALGIGGDVKDIAGVKDASDFMGIHPVQVGMMVAAPYIGAGADALGSIAASKVASMIPESLSASNVGSGILKAASKGAIPAVVGAGVGAIDYYKNRDWLNAIEHGFSAAGAEAALEYGTNLSGKLSGLGDYVAGNAPEGYVPPASFQFAEKLGGLAKAAASTPEFKTGLGGALYSVPFALAEDDPNKRQAMVLNGLAAGAGLGTVSRLGGLLDARYAASKNASFYKDLPTNPTEYGTQYDAPTADSVSRMSQVQKDLLFKQRHIVGKNGQIYVIPDDQFQSVVQPLAEQYYSDQGHAPDIAQNLASNVTGESVFYGADPNGTPRIFVKESAFNPDNMTHEVGHFISSVLKSNIEKAQTAAQLAIQKGETISPEIQSMLDMGKQLDQSVPTGRARQIAEKGYINRLYNLDALQDQIDAVQKQVKGGDVQAQSRLDNLNQIKEQFENIHENGLPDFTFKNEWLSDQFSLAARGLMSGEQAGWKHTISQALGSYLDTASPGAISQYLTNKQTPLGFRPSFIAADVFDHWIEGRAQEIKAEHPDWKPVSANNAPTESPPPSNIPPAPVEPVIQPNGKVVQDATDALTGLKAFGKKAIPGKVAEAIESLRSQGVDISKISPVDIVAEATKGRGQTPTVVAKSNEPLQPKPTPIPKPSDNPPLQGIAQPTEDVAQIPSKTPPKPISRPLSEIDPNGFVDAQELAQGNYLNASEGGLKRASNRSLNKKDLTVGRELQNGLVGERIDPNQPLEAALLRQGSVDSGNPEVFNQSLAAIQDAIAQKKTLSVSYNSAENSLEGTPSSQNRGNAQDASDKGFINRSPTPKTINPTSIEVLRKNEPYFEGDSKAKALQNADNFDFKGKRVYKTADAAKKDLAEFYAANREGRMPDLGEDTNSKVNYLIENFVPTEFKTRFYANSFSFDKMAGNKNLFQRLIIDSDLKDDPYWKKVSEYLKSEDFVDDEKGRLLNSANGLRGDGQPIEGSLVKPTKGYNPYYLDDFKTQIFNALEGGPSATYYQEANQNVSGLRGIKVNPLNKSQGANPLWNKLEALGEKAKVFEKDLNGNTIETNGIRNIFSPATEQIRLDRINNINLAPEKQQMPTSKYGNQAIGFTPGTGKPSWEDATINPASRTRMHYLQGIAGSQGISKKNSELKSQ